MIEYTDLMFSSLFDRGMALHIQNARYTNCVFETCALSLTKEIGKRSIVENVELVNCKSNGCNIGPVILRNITVDNLATNDLLILWGPLFDRVKFVGKIGKIKINHYVHHVDRSEATQAPFDLSRSLFYESTEWAIDISEAKFKGFDFRGIPAQLIRRDPETQVIVTRKQAIQQGWREKVSAWNTLWPFMIDLFLSDGDTDTVLVAPLDAPKRRRDELLKGLKELRDIGVAEPN